MAYRDFPRVRIEGIHISGDFVGRSPEGHELMFDGRFGMPQDLVNAQANWRKRKGKYPARIMETLEAPLPREEALCPHFGVCGGCKWQQVPYEVQVSWKDEILKRHILGTIPKEELLDAEFLPPLPSPRSREYRNKMEYSFSSHRWFTKPDEAENADNRALGLFVPGNPNRVVDIEACALQDPYADRIRNGIGEFARQRGDKFYDHRVQEGYLRTLLIRVSAVGDFLVMVIFGFDDPIAEEAYRDFLEEHYPRISSCYFMTNTKLNDSYADLEPRHQYGQEWLTEHIDGLEFHVGPLSFFQTNIYQTPRLYEEVLNMAGNLNGKTVYDLYCGTGTISAYVARTAHKVLGFEYVQEAVEAAARACRENGIHNAKFFGGDIKDVLTDALMAVEGRPDLIVADPPRAGMHQKVLERILESKAEKLVYVSCNPASLARDLAVLKQAYRIDSVRAVDMAPHTPHVETIVLMSRVKE